MTQNTMTQNTTTRSALTGFATNDCAGNDFARTRFDSATNAGRKGIAYDWQSLLAADGVSAIEAELGTLILARLGSESAE